MKYYLDFEFNGMGGQWLTMALMREDGRSIYLENGHKPYKLDAWVAENVIPVISNSPEQPTPVETDNEAGLMVAWFLAGDAEPKIIADWPDDIKYLSDLLITGPGRMVPIPGPIRFEVHRVDAYPTKVDGAVQHNAWWDAMALRNKLGPPQTKGGLTCTSSPRPRTITPKSESEWTKSPPSLKGRARIGRWGQGRRKCFPASPCFSRTTSRSTSSTLRWRSCSRSCSMQRGRSSTFTG